MSIHFSKVGASTASSFDDSSKINGKKAFWEYPKADPNTLLRSTLRSSISSPVLDCSIYSFSLVYDAC